MNSPTTIAERLLDAMKSAGFASQSALSRASGVPQPTINRILNGIVRGSPAVTTLTSLADACNVNVGWLMDGVGPRERGALQSSSQVPEEYRAVEVLDEDDPRFVQIKKVQLRVSAGISGFEVDHEYPGADDDTLSLTRRWIQKKQVRKDDLIAIQVRGESMTPTLYDGDIVVIDTSDRRLIDGFVYVFNYEGEVIVKRASRDAGKWYLTSDNPDQRRYHRKLCEGDGCMVIGRVIRRESDQL